MRTPLLPPSSLSLPPRLSLGGVCWSKRWSSERRMETRVCWGKFERWSGCRWMKHKNKNHKSLGELRNPVEKNCCPRARKRCRWRAGWRFRNSHLCAPRAELPVRAFSVHVTAKTLICVQTCWEIERVRGAERCGAPAPTEAGWKSMPLSAAFRRVWFEWIVLRGFRSRS